MLVEEVGGPEVLVEEVGGPEVLVEEVLVEVTSPEVGGHGPPSPGHL